LSIIISIDMFTDAATVSFLIGFQLNIFVGT